MDDPHTEDRLIEQLAAHLREQKDDVVDEQDDPAMRERLLDMMQSSRAGTPTLVRSSSKATGNWWWWMAGGLAAAAAVVLMVIPPVEPVTEQPPIVVAELSNYELAHDGGLATQRSGDTPPEGVPRFRTGTPFELTMIPDNEVTDPVSLRMCARPKAGGPEVEIDVRELVDPESGSSFRLRGRAGQLGLQPGTWTLVVAVGYPDALGKIESVCRASESNGVQIGQMELEMLAD